MVQSTAPTHGDIRQGFVYKRAPHIELKSIANNARIDVIWESWRETLERLNEDLNAKLDRDWEEWQIPREASEDWPAEAAETHRSWWEARIARQQEIDGAIAADADDEYLYDRPYEDNRKVRVAGPFTVESLSPHRVLTVDENEELLDRVAEAKTDYGPQRDFAGMILEQLATAGVQQATQGGPHRLRLGHPVAGRVHLRRGSLRRRPTNQRGEAGRHLRGPRIRHRITPRPRGGGARGGGRRLRRADRLRV